MLDKFEKELVHTAMDMFEDNFVSDKLIKQTARYVSQQVSTWKRGSVYKYTREHYNNTFTEEDADPYLFTYNGKEEAWFCVLWYDGPKIFESHDRTRIMLETEEHSQLKQFTMIYMSYNAYDKRVMANTHNTQKGWDNFSEELRKVGIKHEEVYIMYKNMNIQSWSDNLYETKPEIFI